MTMIQTLGVSGTALLFEYFKEMSLGLTMAGFQAMFGVDLILRFMESNAAKHHSRGGL